MKKNVVGFVLAILLLLLCAPTASHAEVSTTPTVVITHTLSLGSQGVEVSALQQILKNKGYFTYPTITGYFGEITKVAVMAFQKVNNIGVDGIIGSITRAKLYELPLLGVTNPVTPPVMPPKIYGGTISHRSSHDEESPEVSITAPVDEDTVSGSLVEVTADATDNVSVAGVQFQVDGSDVGTEDTTLPYAISWDSTSTEDGVHAITAIARDGVGNTATSDSISVTVSNSKTLTVAKAGTGSGIITSSPAGINCGATCASSFASGAMVDLSASPSVGSTFVGWSGGGCAGTGSCVVTMSATTTVTATFSLVQYTATVSKAGGGDGTVTSAPSGVNCGVDCSEAYDYGTVVTLSAAAAPGSVFAGWSGACTGVGTCVVTMTAAKNITATFDPI